MHIYCTWHYGVQNKEEEDCRDRQMSEARLYCLYVCVVCVCHCSNTCSITASHHNTALPENTVRLR